jgi:hypothetical protein
MAYCWWMKMFYLIHLKITKFCKSITQSFCNKPTNTPMFFFSLSNHLSIQLIRMDETDFSWVITYSLMITPKDWENNAFQVHLKPNLIIFVASVLFMFLNLNYPLNFSRDCWFFFQWNDGIKKLLCFESNHKLWCSLELRQRFDLL